MRRSEARYQALARMTAQLIWFADASGCLVEDSPSWRAFTGSSRAPRRKLCWLDALHPDERPSVAQWWSEVTTKADTAGGMDATCRLRRFDGAYERFSVRAEPVHADQPADAGDASGSGIDEWACRALPLAAPFEQKPTHQTPGRREEQERRPSGAGADAAGPDAKELAAIFDVMTDAMLIYDGEGRVRHANASAIALLGLDTDPSFAARPLQERMERIQLRDEQGQPLDALQGPVARVLHGERLNSDSTAEVWIRTLDGRERRLSITGAPVRDAAGQIVGAVCVMRDVTRRRALEQRQHLALDAVLTIADLLVSPATNETPGDAAAHLNVASLAQRLAELARGVLACNRVGVLALDAQTDALHLLGGAGAAGEQVRQTVTAFEGTRLRDHLGEAQVRRLKNGEVLLLDLSKPPFNRRPYGVPSSAGTRNALIAPMRLHERLIGVLMLDYEAALPIPFAEAQWLTAAIARLAAIVLQRDELLRERGAAQARVVELDAERQRMDEFISIASHELRSPLTSMKLSVQVAAKRIDAAVGESATSAVPLDHPSVPQSVRDLLGRTDAQITRLTRLVEDMLDASRIQAGKLELRPVTTDLLKIVRDAVEEQRDSWPDREIILRLPRRERVPVFADPVRIAQVTTNYLTNALKYSPPERPVYVRLRLEGAERHIARLSVRDEGPGLPPAERKRIWERFHRAAGIRQLSGQSGAGLSLGLYISRTIIERHGGAVGIRTSQGRGSTFWFTVPLAGDE